MGGLKDELAAVGIEAPDLAPAYLAAWYRGWTAASDGRPRWAVDRDYPDHRTTRGAVTFARAFRNAWLDGYDAKRRR